MKVHITEDDVPGIKNPNFLKSFNNFLNYEKLEYVFYDCLVKTPQKQSFICDKSGKLLENTLQNNIFWIPSCITAFFGGSRGVDGKHYLPKHPPKELFEEVNKRISSFKKQAEILDNNYDILLESAIDLTWARDYMFGHIFDVLQRLFPIKDKVINEKTKFIVSDYSKINDFLTHLSVISGREIQKKDIFVANQNKVIYVKELIYSLSPTIPCSIDRDFYIWMINKYYDHFSIEDPKPIYNLYLSRNHIHNNYRGVLNEKEVIDCLSKNYDFHILYGNEPLEKTINYFANSNMVIFPHGSAGMNTLFSNKNTKILEYYPKTYPRIGVVDQNICGQFKMAKKNHRQIVLNSDNKCNITIDTKKLAETIATGWVF